MNNQTPNIEEILADPSVSNWFKKAVAELNQRDLLDAFNDIKLLEQVFKYKLVQQARQMKSGVVTSSKII